MVRSTAQEYAYREIKKRIIEGTLEPLQPVVEEEISAKLKISRTPLRAALQRLEIEKLVERQENGRLRISNISIKEVKEIFKVRSKLEEIAVCEATENATEQDLIELAQLADMIHEALQSKDLEEILKYGSKFHTYIYQLSGNRTVNNFISQLNDHIHRYRRLVPNHKLERTIEEGKEHHQIVRCMANRDAEGAGLAMKQHIENSLNSAVDAIRIYESSKQATW
ncbi:MULTISPECIES: GntR family transcriptional regulator [Bhargavaea]|uniref:GntR family transcriptional regulator n=1 Tax=Bhargavaea changchunensis TaxID=2134037 RepID=A0ABW2NGJ6_9BACL|nr:GntR family transcriptional regulator [Bhargavaea sp. CC-171006]